MAKLTKNQNAVLGALVGEHHRTLVKAQTISTRTQISIKRVEQTILGLEDKGLVQVNSYTDGNVACRLTKAGREHLQAA